MNAYHHVTMPFQQEHLPQYSPFEALQKGTLWPALYHPYPRTAQTR